jgi:hypothetical protein
MLVSTDTERWLWRAVHRSPSSNILVWIRNGYVWSVTASHSLLLKLYEQQTRL